MTEEEVQIIYDYLHENYEYREDGELLHRFDLKNGSKKKGETIGSVCYSNTNRAYLQTKLHINGKTYRQKINKCIYIYHNKKYPKYLIHLDDNPLNNKIENLQESSHSLIQHQNALRKERRFLPVKNKDGTMGFTLCSSINNKSVKLGTYRTAEIATQVYFDVHLLINEGKTEQEIKDYLRFKYPDSSLNILSKTGFKGVSCQGGKFIAQARINGKRIYIGSYISPEEAHAAYLKAKEEYKN